MAFDNDFRNLVQRGIQERINQYKNWDIDHKKSKQMLKYENENDFWYGHILGSILTSTVMIFKNALGRKPTKEEEEEIWELIQIHAKDIREVLKTWK